MSGIVAVKGSINWLWREVKGEDEWWGDLKEDVKQQVKAVIGLSMEYGVRAYTGAERHERSFGRVAYRNGYYKRSLETEYGLIEDIAVPRARGMGVRDPLRYSRGIRGGKKG